MQSVRFFYLLIVLLILYSCRKKIEKPQWDIDVVFPIASTTLSFNNIVRDTLIKTSSDKTLSLVYRGDMYGVNFDSLFKLPDTSIVTTFPIPPLLVLILGGKLLPGYMFVDKTDQIYNDLKGVFLTKALIRSGTAEVVLKSTLKGRSFIKYTIPIASKNGNSLVVTDTLPPATSTSSVSITKNINLSGYWLDLRGLQQNYYNFIVTKVQATALDTIAISDQDTISIVNNFKGLVPDQARGYFGETNVEIKPTSQSMDIFKGTQSSSFDLEKISFILSVRNGVGADLQAKFTQLTSVNTSNNSTVTLSSALTSNKLNISRSSETGNPVSPVKYTEKIISMNEINSNADRLIEIMPDNFIYAMSLSINPLGNVSNDNDFIYYGHGINLSLDVQVPLSFTASNLVLSDTVALTVSGLQDSSINNYSKGYLHIDLYNGFPFRVLPQLFLADGNKKITDTILYSPSEIVAAVMDGANKVSEKKFSRLTIAADKTRIDKVKAAKYLFIKASFYTAGSGYVKVYSDYSMDVKLVVELLDYEL